MTRLLCLLLLVTSARAQSSQNATELLEKVKIFGEATRSWRAEAIHASRVTVSPSIMLKDEVHISIAAQRPLKMSRVNSGDDRTVMVCDGTNFFYSGDGLSYYMYRATQQCDVSLMAFYEPSLMRLYEPYKSPNSITIIGEDHVRLSDGERRCVVVRAVSRRESMHDVRTMCIDPSRPIILRDTFETEDDKTGNKSFTETTVTSFENNPTFSPDTFRITIPVGAVEAKPPM